MSREELINELVDLVSGIKDGRDSFEHIADFIIADRKRVVEPLLKYREPYGNLQWTHGDQYHFSKSDLKKSIDETIKLAGVEL